MAGRDSKGRFVKGHKITKYDIDKDQAREFATDELLYIITTSAHKSYREVKELIDSEKLKDESLMTHMIIKKAHDGDMKPMQWVYEMVAGKPRQQLEHSGKVDTNISLVIDEQDKEL